MRRRARKWPQNGVTQKQRRSRLLSDPYSGVIYLASNSSKTATFETNDLDDFLYRVFHANMGSKTALEGVLLTAQKSC